MTDPIWSNIFKIPGEIETIALLKKVPIFDLLDFLKLRKLVRFLHQRDYRADEIIFRENEPGESLYVIKSGRVRIFSRKDDGTERELAVLEAGSFFGEVSLVDEAPRSAFAVATEDTRLLGLFRADLLRLVDRDPRLASQILFRLASVIARRLRFANHTVPRRETHVD